MNRRTVVIGVVLGLLVAILLMIVAVQSPITAHSYTVDLNNCIKTIETTDIYRITYDCSVAPLN